LNNERGKGGGRNPKINDSQKEELRKMLSIKEYWTTKEVYHLINDYFDVEYSEDSISRLLRDFGMNLQKPSPIDYRRRDNAEITLINQLKLTFKLLEKKQIDLNDIALGFYDETSPQTTANTVRVWSFSKRPKIIKNTNKIKLNAAGFYPIKGNQVVKYLENSKQDEICNALEAIREVNKGYKAIVVVIDNFSSHKTEKVLLKAEELNIYLVFLPPYCPDLNPIEYIWKSIKRVISLKFIHNKKYMQEVFDDCFDELGKKLSFAKNWIEEILKPMFDNGNNVNYVKLCG